MNTEPFRPVWEAFARELAEPHPFGQPLVNVEQFPRTGLEGVTVIWDRFAKLTDVERSAVILRGYQEVHGEAAANKVVFAVGYTTPEAIAAGHLPFTVLPALRAGDVVTEEDCRREMVAIGASTLPDPERPVLAAPTLEQAEGLVNELVRRLPGSRPVWVLRKEILPSSF